MAQIKLAEYTFDNSVGDCLPTLTPNTITMTKEDTVSGTTTKRIVYIDNSIMPRQISFNGRNSLLTLDYLNMGTNITSMYQMFYSCTSVTMIDCTGWNTSNVTDMYQLFNYCPKLREIKSLETINTSKITNMAWFFRYCDLVDVSGIANWDVSKVTNMNGVFQGCSSLTSLDLSSWDVSQCTNISNMFSGCSKLTIVKLDNWNTSKVTNMEGLFASCYAIKNIDLSSFTTESKPYMPRIFMDVPIRMVDLSNIIYYDGMDMGMFRWNSGTTEDIIFGMLYTDAKTINKLVEAYWNGDNGTNPVIIY